MQFKIHGGLSVTDDAGDELALGPAKQRAVLGVLALEANRVVSVDRLTDAVWGDEAPSRVSASLQAYLSNLRRVLEPGRKPRDPARVLVTRAPGYVLVVERADLDLTHAEDLVVAGHAAALAGDHEAALAAFEEAEKLTSQLPLPELEDEEWMHPVRTRWESERGALLEALFDVRLAAGDHARAIAAIEAAVEQHPFRERLRVQLALALYRADRQADALRSIDAARHILVEELGLEPSASLRRLESDILAQSADLDLDVAPAAPPPAEKAAAEPEVAPLPAPDDSRDQQLFVGRAEEFGTLKDAVDSVRRGATRIIAISGEPGMGKTKLASEAARYARDLGMPVCWARCPENAAVPPFWVMSKLGRDALASGAVDSARMETMLRPATDPTPPEATTARMSLYQQSIALLKSASRPILLVADDLQWSDTASLRMLEFAIAELEGAPLCVILTARPTGPDSPVALVDAFAEVTRSPLATRIDLSGLSTEEVLAWLVERWATATRSDAEAVKDRSGGNPFFVRQLVELVSSEARQGDLAAKTAHIPVGVGDVVRRRVARLPVETQRLLSTASVVGRSFDVDVLAEVVGITLDDALDGLDAAFAAGLLVDDPDAPLRFAFSHALVAESLAAEANPARRARWHCKALRALEQLRADNLDQHLDELAHHALEGMAAGTASAAYDYSVRAALAAQDQVGYEDAARHWQGAVRALEVARPSDRRARYDALVNLGIARQRGDDMNAGEQAILSAMREAEAMGDPSLMSAAAVHLSQPSLWIRYDHGQIPTETIDLLERTLHAMAPDDRPERARVLSALAIAVYFADPDRCLQLSAEAVGIGRRLGDPVLLSLLLVERFMSAWRTDAAELVDIGREIIELHDGIEVSDELRFTGPFALAVSSFHLSDRETLETALAEALEIAERSQSPMALTQLGFMRAAVATVDGRWSEAEAIALEYYDLYRRTRRTSAEDVYLGVIGPTWFERGALNDLLSMQDAAMERSYSDIWREFLVWMLVESGEEERARELAGPPGVPLEFAQDWTWAHIMTIATSARAGMNDLEVLPAAYAQLLPLAGRFTLVGSGGYSVGPVDLALARAAEAMGDREVARGHYEAAVGLCERMRARVALARCLTHQAIFLSAGTEAERSQALAGHNRATELADALGLVPVGQLLKRSETLLTR